MNGLDNLIEDILKVVRTRGLDENFKGIILVNCGIREANYIVMEINRLEGNTTQKWSHKYRPPHQDINNFMHQCLDEIQEKDRRLIIADTIGENMKDPFKPYYLSTMSDFYRVDVFSTLNLNIHHQ